MSSPWSAPPAAPAHGAPREPDGPGLREDAAAAGVTAAALVLLGAPLGLLWAALAPRVQVVLGGTGGPGLVDPETSAFVVADLGFGLLALGAGLVCGLVALLVPALRAYGPGTVVGLLVGGLLAAFVASRTGQEVGLEEFRAAVRDPQGAGTVDATVRLRAVEALVLWPVGALVAYAVGTALRRDHAPAEPGVSWG